MRLIGIDADGSVFFDLSGIAHLSYVIEANQGVLGPSVHVFADSMTSQISSEAFRREFLAYLRGVRTGFYDSAEETHMGSPVCFSSIRTNDYRRGSLCVLSSVEARAGGLPGGAPLKRCH